MNQPVGIVGTGSYLPGDPVPTEAMDDVLGIIHGLSNRTAVTAKRMAATILGRTGVKQRYYAIDPVTRRQTETNASIAEKAVRAALEAADIPADSIDLLIVAGPMADYACPPTSALLQGRLGIRNCTEIEVHSNCTGTPKAIQIAFDMLRIGRYKRAAIAYAQISSSFLRSEFFNPEKVQLENLALRWIMSDGAGALILERDAEGLSLVDAHVESIGGHDAPGMQGFMHGAFAHEESVAGKNFFPALHESGEHHIIQHIGEVSRNAPRHIVEGLRNMLDNAGVAAASVTEFVLGIPGRHFITEQSIAYFRQLIGVDPLPRIAFSSVEDFGYCGGATMLVQIDRLVRGGTLKPGDTIAAYLEESSKWMSGGFVARMQ